jgi:outer membrane murein-binding lipoprotein Lpp
LILHKFFIRVSILTLKKMEKIVTRFRTLRAEMDDLISQMEALGVKETAAAPAAVPAKKATARSKKEKVEAQKVTEREEVKADGRRKPMTDEHKAKLKAGREAAKARRDAEKAAAAAAEAAGGADDDVVFDEEEDAPTDRAAAKQDSPRQICRKCVVNLKYGTDHRRCFFKGIEEGLWEGESGWVKDCEEFAKRFAAESE